MPRIPKVVWITLVLIFFVGYIGLLWHAAHPPEFKNHPRFYMTKVHVEHGHNLFVIEDRISKSSYLFITGSGSALTKLD